MNRINNQALTGERALFKSEDLEVSDCYFYDGESPLKESLRLLILNLVGNILYGIVIMLRF